MTVRNHFSMKTVLGGYCMFLGILDLSLNINVVLETIFILIEVLLDHSTVVSRLKGHYDGLRGHSSYQPWQRAILVIDPRNQDVRILVH